MISVLTIVQNTLVSYGGLTSVALNYYRQIDRNLIHMDFASSNILDADLAYEFADRGSTYYLLPKRKKVFKYILEIKKIAKNYDVVHIHGNSATASIELIGAFLAKTKKRIIHIHNSTCKHKIINVLLKPLFRILYTDAIACSKSAGAWMFKNKKHYVLNNAINLEKYIFSNEQRLALREKYGIQSDEIVIGDVAKMNNQKNHFFLVDVFQSAQNFIPNSKLLLVGGGPLFNEVKEYVIKKKLEKKVVFCGMQNDAWMFYSAMDVILRPSFWEGLPLSIVEAQATGLKCVISDCITSDVNMGGVISISLNENAERWAYILSNSCGEDREYLANIYRNNIKNKGFDVQSNVKELIDIYNS